MLCLSVAQSAHSVSLAPAVGSAVTACTMNRVTLSTALVLLGVPSAGSELTARPVCRLSSQQLAAS